MMFRNPLVRKFRNTIVRKVRNTPPAVVVSFVLKKSPNKCIFQLFIAPKRSKDREMRSSSEPQEMRTTTTTTTTTTTGVYLSIYRVLPTG